ncbi:hypothetical protein [Hahella sp. HN01]|uniref:hypothetical protein n=1 Tax=Hahella sp. HN01 TaxID=2847262 RepID=UPI001C1EBA57|nr:hypothetical protein [Hahella sp. HN01]MBU6955798.1 hypothetical protein [Hahella sp. HN01]
MEKTVCFISGHLDLTPQEFEQRYAPAIDQALESQAGFVVGDARGADKLAQDYLFGKSNAVTVYHMFDTPRDNPGFPSQSGFTSDNQRDKQMTAHSTCDIAWVRPGREKSGTARNLARR